jgi:anti-sigma factor RsiW
MAAFSCRDNIARLTDYFERALLPPQRLAVEAHLRRCDDCVAYMRQYDQTITLSKVAYEEP